MSEPIVFGAAYSVYVRAARLALEEKGVRYRLVEVDIFAEEGPPPDYLTRQPFRRIPAFEHDGFRLYETGAITRYIDDAFPGQPLMPVDAKSCARANQIISILDNYGYRPLVREIYVQRVFRPQEGRAPNEALIAMALPYAEKCLSAVTDLAHAGGPFLAGAAVSLADIHAAPMFAYFCQAPEAAEMMARHPRLERWWQNMRSRPSMLATKFEGE